MNLTLLHTEKTKEADVASIERRYYQRIENYINFKKIEIPIVKTSIKSKLELHSIIKFVGKGDMLVLFDEKGKHVSSIEFAAFLQKQMNSGLKSLVFATGGAYGFTDDVYERAEEMIALSKLTFPHQLVRVIAAEQIYRALSILAGEKYHH